MTPCCINNRSRSSVMFQTRYTSRTHMKWSHGEVIDLWKKIFSSNKENIASIKNCLWFINIFQLFLHFYYSHFVELQVFMITSLGCKPLHHASSDLEVCTSLTSEYSSCSTYRLKDFFFPFTVPEEISVCPPCPSLPAPKLYKPYHKHLQLSACFMKPEAAECTTGHFTERATFLKIT